MLLNTLIALFAERIFKEVEDKIKLYLENPSELKKKTVKRFEFLKNFNWITFLSSVFCSVLFVFLITSLFFKSPLDKLNNKLIKISQKLDKKIEREIACTEDKDFSEVKLYIKNNSK